MRRLAPLVAVLALLLPLAGCTDDDPIDSVRFTIFVDNRTDVDYDVWVTVDVVNDPFVRQSSVAAQEIVALRDRLIGLDYTLRLVPTGQAVQQYDFQTTITSTGDDETWTVP